MTSQHHEALTFYRDRLGHELLWRSETSAGLAFAESGKIPELVLHTDHWPIAAAIKVECVLKAIERFVSSGGSVVEPASDIAIGCPDAATYPAIPRPIGMRWTTCPTRSSVCL